MVMTAKQFATVSGFPLATIRRLCREKRLPCWKIGRVYFLDETKALARLELMKETETGPEMTSSPRQPRRRQRVDDGSRYGSDYLMNLIKKKARLAATRQA